MRALNGRWELYQGMSEEAVRAAYRRKWGREPREIRAVYEWMYAGPIEEEKDGVADFGASERSQETS